MHALLMGTLLLLSQPADLPHCGGAPVNPNGHGWVTYDLGYHGPQILYLNFEGGVLRGSGFDDPTKNASWIVGQHYQEVEFPPFDDEPYRTQNLQSRRQVIAAVVGWVRDYYAPFNVVVTTERPPDDVPYTMIMVGGHASDIGEPGGGEVGVAPGDCGNSNPAEIGFAFAADLRSVQDLAVTIAHEAGHSFGLSHIDVSRAIMYPVVSPDPYWESGSIPDTPICPGAVTQDSFETLATNIGTRSDTTAPWVTFLYPGDGAVTDSNIEVLLNGGDTVDIPIVGRIFLDGKKWGEKSWPYFRFSVSGMSAGTHTLSAEVEDRSGHVGRAEVTITVKPGCSGTGSCTQGRGGIGAPCSKGSDCMSGICVFSGGTGACSRECEPDTSSCGLIGSCVAHEGTHYCSPFGKVDDVIHEDEEALLACSVSGHRGRLPGWLMALLFALVGVLRRNYA